MGSKKRIAKEILPIILKDRKPGQYYVEPFVGGANLIDKVDGNRIGADNNMFLIAMWKKLQQGWIPPKEITREYYNNVRRCYNNLIDDFPVHIIGYVGFNGSYNGRFFDGGYAGITKIKKGKFRNYPLEAFNNIQKQVSIIKDVVFKYCDYDKLFIPTNSIIYCDPPYKNSKRYKTALKFNYDKFWQWCRDKVKEGHQVFVSEYDAPDDFKCIWSKEIVSSLTQDTGSKKGIEKLFVHESQCIKV